MQDDGAVSSSSTLQDAPDSLKFLFDPSPSPSNRSEPYFASAINSGSRPNLRRRGSASGRSTPASKNASLDYDWGAYLGSRSHTRSHTTSSQDRMNGHHPLHSATIAANSPAVGRTGVTRPHLARLLDWNEAQNGQIDQTEVGNIPKAKPRLLVDIHGDRPPSAGQNGSEEKEVIVHKVGPTDSLAGVALKYGISLAELRKANQLWASDSIHLRKVLYIPLDVMSSQTAATFRAMLLNESESNGVTEENDQESRAGSSSGSLEWGTSPTSTIRRIPASQLSFFPPSSSSAHDTPPSTTVVEPETQPIPVYNHHTRSATAPSPSLTALLTALPIAASTRDTIIARLSFESSRSSSTSDDQEHEMDNVRAGHDDEEPFKTPKAQYYEPNQHAPRTAPPLLKSAKGKARASPPPSPRRDMHSRSSSSYQSNGNVYDIAKDAGYDGIAKVQLTSTEPLSGVRQRPATIRTMQMEPSPAMELPAITRPGGVGIKYRPRSVHADDGN